MFRTLLFVLTNLAIVVVLGIVMRLLGLDGYLTSEGLNYEALLIFCFAFGMVGAFISLLLSKFMAKKATGTTLIENPRTQQEIFLVTTVEEIARSAGIGMPDVGIFPANEANAFATGANRNKALVAISSGMLERYSPSEIKAVLAHEVSHVANGDMITMVLLQGVINTFVMFFARVIGFVVDRAILKNEGGRGVGFVVTTIFCEIVLGLLASIITMWFSRRREYKADEGAARLAGAPAMVAALAHLQRESEMSTEGLPQSLNAFGINGQKGSALKALFMSHPPLEKRIEALRNFVD
ncbi:MAG: protease HtpX [Helicobacteraceae bacterium]|nr:protease HtpX [Helicobacteraceae bacterium]